jgi:hypothetical protein
MSDRRQVYCEAVPKDKVSTPLLKYTFKLKLAAVI